MYEYDTILNGKISRNVYAEKLNEAANERKANAVANRKGIRNLLNIFS